MSVRRDREGDLASTGGGYGRFPQTGGCQCGVVRYQITETPIVVYTCHSTDCHRVTASAFSLGVVVPEDAFVSQPSVELRVIESVADSGRIRRRYICMKCAV